MAIDLGSINPLANAKIGSLSTFATGLLVFFIVVVILALIGVLIYVFVVKKQFFLRIRVFRNVGNVPTEIAFFKAREVSMGMAGDKLWRVAPNSVWQMPFKVVKWLSAGKKQSAPNEFWYWIREDGEWINFTLADIDEKSRQMGVKFTQEDMRLQRLATDRLLEQRLTQKTFWEKWGNVIMTIIFFLVTAVCMVIIFYQWSKLLDKMIPMVDAMTKSLQLVQKTCPAFVNETLSGGGSASGLIPA